MFSVGGNCDKIGDRFQGCHHGTFKTNKNLRHSPKCYHGDKFVAAMTETKNSANKHERYRHIFQHDRLFICVNIEAFILYRFGFFHGKLSLSAN